MKKLFIVADDKKILLTEDEELISVMGDYKKFLNHIETETLRLHDSGYSDLAVSKKLRITEESVRFFIQRRKDLIDEMNKLFDPLFKDIFSK